MLWVKSCSMKEFQTLNLVRYDSFCQFVLSVILSIYFCFFAEKLISKITELLKTFTLL
jgi:hypothetical protein